MRIRDGGPAAARCLDAVAARLRLSASDLDLDRTLKAHGLDSLAIVELMADLSAEPGPVPVFEDLGIAPLGDVRLVDEKPANTAIPTRRSQHVAALSRFSYLGSGDPYVLQLVLNLDTAIPCADLAAVVVDLTGALAYADERRLWHVCEHADATATTIARAGIDARERCARRAEQRTGTFELTHVGSSTEGGGALIATMHHSESDLWSAGLLLQQVDLLLAARRDGRSGEVAVTMPGDVELAAREAQALSDEATGSFRRLVAAELNKLAPTSGDSRVLERGQDVYRCAEFRRPLPARVSDTIEALAHAYDVDRTAVCLTAFGVVVARYLRSRDLVLGLPMWNRRAHELRAIGPLTNTVPVPLRWDERAPMAEVLRSVDAFVSRSISACRAPYGELARADGRPAAPLDALFSLQDALPAEADMPGLREALSLGWPSTLDGEVLRGRFLAATRRTSEMPFDLAVCRTTDGYKARLVIDRRWGEGIGAAQFLDCFEEVLLRLDTSTVHDVVSAPLRCLRPADWTEPTSGQFADGPLFDRVRAIARARPEAPAIRSARSTLTFAALVSEVEQRAGAIPAGTGSVCIWPGEGVDSILNLLASVEAHVPFFCFDGTETVPRVEAMCAALPKPLTSLLGPDGPTAPQALASVDHRTPTPSGGTNDLPAVAAGQTVYFASTSGTSGSPKLVGVTAANLNPLIEWFATTVGLDTNTTLVKTLSLGFDFGLEEVFAVLFNGGCVVVPDRRSMFAGDEFARTVRDLEVDTWFTTPSLLDTVLAEAHDLRSLRTVLVGGEAFRWDSLDRLRSAVGPDCRVWNGYGPTEATINSTAYLVKDDSSRTRAATVPIGQASARTVLRVLDEQDGDVPVGVPGELTLGGANVTGGYVGQNQGGFARIDGVWAYRTGDRVVVLGSGDLVYLGRMDREVKVRGVRINLGDIEAVVRAVPGVEDCECRVDEAQGQCRLQARVRPAAGQSFDELVDRLRAHVRRVLPRQAIPTQFVPAERAVDPRTGKAALTAPPGLPGGPAGPASVQVPLEQGSADVLTRVCEVYAEVTGAAAPIDPDAPFQAAGGDGLLVGPVQLLLESDYGLARGSLGLRASTSAREAARRVRLLRTHTEG